MGVVLGPIAVFNGQAKLKPAPVATREQLIRRVSFDLTGLPPTLDQIDAFLADESDDAYETVVNRFVYGPVCAGFVGPYMPIIGTPATAAICDNPLQFDTTIAAFRSRSNVSRIERLSQ